jgi:hypothetical protein
MEEGVEEPALQVIVLVSRLLSACYAVLVGEL